MPISAYLFFATGVNNFSKLPIITEQVSELPIGESSLGKQPRLEGKITVVGFLGTDLFKNRGDAFNLNQKIYNRYKEFDDFQMVFVVPVEAKEEAELVRKELEPISDLFNWNYLFLERDAIQGFFDSLGLVGKLDKNYATSNVYIIDKELNLRGRKGLNKQGRDEYMEGYNTISAADLHNEMMDDMKVVLAEYRLALKKYNRINTAK